MTKTIEQLQARVAELEREKVDFAYGFEFFRNETKRHESELREQLAAAQAEIKRLRDALENTIRHFGMKRLGESRLVDTEIRCKAHEALAQPSDTSALDSFVAEKVKEYQKHNGILGREVKDLTRQRDLAVEAMREALECGEDGDWQSARRILASVIKESEVK